MTSPGALIVEGNQGGEDKGGDSRQAPRRTAWVRSVRGWVAVGLTVLSIVLLATNAQLPSLEEAARRSNHQLLILAFFLSLLTIVCKAARWRALYPAQGRPSLGLSTAAIAVGQVANWAVPTRVGEVLRVGMVAPESAQGGRTSQGVALSVGVLAAEKLLDGAMLILAVALLALFGGLPNWLRLSGMTLVASIGVGALALSVVLRTSPRARRAGDRALGLFLKLLPDRLSAVFRHVESIGEGLFAWLKVWTAAQVVIWSLGAWGIGGAVNYAVLRSLGLNQGLGAALAVLVALYGGAAVPSLPGRVGVFQYLCVLALTPFGVGFDQGLAFSLALYAVVYLPPLALGLLSALLVGLYPSALGRHARPRTRTMPLGNQAGEVRGDGGVEGRDLARRLMTGSEAEMAEEMERSAPRYSVIVPVYNGAQVIEACIRALLDQSVPREAYEVLIVDDGSTDNTAELAGRYPVRVLRQAHAGPASARNLGAKAAQGMFLVFTDADCLPVRTWIEEIVRPLETNDQVAGVQGTYRTKQTSLVARFTQVELEVKYEALGRQPYIDFLDTASAALRRDAFWDAGAFDPRFSKASNEDTQLAFNLASKGKRLVFVNDAIVYHRHSESLIRYLKRKWRHGYWRMRVYRQHPEKMAGDSYTPRSTQVQLLMAALTLLIAPLPGLHVYALVTGLLFVLATLPFVRRALLVGFDVAVAVPFILFLRALALGMGLVIGGIALVMPFGRPSAAADEGKPIA